MYTSLWYLAQDRNWTLEELNQEQVKVLIPSLVYTSFLMIIGILGNFSVLFIYFFKFKSSNHRCFILTLGVFDTVMCTVGMPFLIVDMMFPFMFYNIWACRILRFMNYYLSLVSINVLFLISLERYRKICQPLKTQLSVTIAKKCILVIVILIGPVMSCPAFMMYGHNTVDTGVPYIKGVQCFSDDSVRHSWFPVVYNMTLLFVCGIYGTGMGICYIQIARQRFSNIKARQHASRTKLLKTSPTTSSTNYSDVTFNATSCLTGEVNANTVDFSLGAGTHEANDASTQTDATENSKAVSLLVSSTTSKHHLNRQKHDVKAHFIKRCETMSVKMSDWREKRTIRITKILFIITMVYTLSITPHFLVMITIFLKEDFLTSMGPVTASVYQIAMRSFLINAVANPIIYGCIDKKFRSEFSKIFYRKHS